MTLKPKQARFVDEYVLDLNATQAAIRAGYSPATAKQQGSRLLTNVDICSAIAEKQEAAAEKHEITRESITAKLELAYKAAAKFKQSGGMVQAQLGIAKLHGMVTDKKQLSGDPDNPLQLNISSLMERIDGRSRALPEPRGPVGGPILEAEPSVSDHRQGGGSRPVPDERRTDETLQ